MADLLVKLYDLPALAPILEDMRAKGIEIRRAIAPERHVICDFIRGNFSPAWVSETEVAFGHVPIGVWVAAKDGKCIGFACFDATSRGFFGPEGVDNAFRGQGIGKALLLATLHDMRAQGYGYAIIGWAGPVDFYAKTVGATVIEGSQPGVYKGLLRAQ